MTNFKEKYKGEYNTAEYLGMQIDKGGWVHREYGPKKPGVTMSGWYVVCHISEFKNYIETTATR